MILKKLRLESFRCFQLPLELGPFGERITVVHGPNGIGKSTVLLALERSLFDRPDSQAAEMDALVPWGSAVTPRVDLDLSVDSVGYRMEKTFGARGQARLYQQEGGRLVPWREGAAAVEWLRDHFGGRQPARGATRPEHRGLGQVLFVPQGELELPERLGDGAVERLRAMVGTVMVDPVTRTLEAELKRRHEQLFTGGGQPKKGAPLQVAREQLAEAEAELQAARTDWQRLDETLALLRTATDGVTALEARRHRLTGDKERLTPLAKEVRALETRHAEALRELEAARAAFDALAGRIQAIADLRQRALALDARVAVLAAAETAGGRATDEAMRAADAAGAALKAHEAERARVRDARRRAEEARTLCRAVEELGELEPRLATLDAAAAQVAALAPELAASRGAFSGQRIRELRLALAEEAHASAALESLRIRVRVRAVAEVEVGGERLAKGETRELSGEGTLALRVAGAELEIAGPAVDLDSARAALSASRARADELAALLGSRDPSELEVRRATHKKLEAQLEVARARLDGSLRPGETRESLQKRLASVQAARAQVLTARPHWATTTTTATTTAPAPGPLEEEARALESRFEQTREQLLRDDESRRRAVDEALVAREQHRRELGTARDAQKLVEGELRAATADGLADEEREARRRSLSALKQAAEDTTALAAESRARIPGDPAEELEAILGDADALFQSLSEVQKEQARHEQTLAQAAAGAPHLRVAVAEERVAVLKGEVERAQLEAASIQLLWRLFEEEHASASAQLVAPVTSRVLPRLKKLTGGRPDIDSLELDETLTPRAVRVRAAAAPVPLDALSYGTRDQLALLVRLALGEIVAGASPLPAVLDDPLVHADKTRLKRFLALLEETSQHLQLIILTCRPEDYRALPATFLDLAGDGLPKTSY